MSWRRSFPRGSTVKSNFLIFVIYQNFVTKKKQSDEVLKTLGNASGENMQP